MSTFRIVINTLANNPVLFVLKIIGRVKYAIRYYLLRDIKLRSYRDWLRDDGDHTLLVNCELNSDDLVFDVGGYVGDFAAAILTKSESNVFVFEPVKSFYDICERRFSEVDAIRCYNFGLSDKEGDFEIALEDDGSSLIKVNTVAPKEIVHTKSFMEFVRDNNIDEISLLKINIEGGEYDLLNQILDTGLIRDVRNLRV